LERCEEEEEDWVGERRQREGKGHVDDQLTGCACNAEKEGVCVCVEEKERRTQKRCGN